MFQRTERKEIGVLDKIRIHIKDILLCLSHAEGIVSPALSRHHQQVAYLSCRLAERLNFSSEQCKDIYLAALIHDVGALSLDERLEIIESEPLHVNHHAFRGAKLFHDFKPLRAASNLIRYHHLPWENGAGLRHQGEKVPISSHLIHLADRTCAKLKPSRNILSQLPGVLDLIGAQRGSLFVPEQVDALFELRKTEFVWLDLMSQDPVQKLPDGIVSMVTLTMDDLVELAYLFSHIIDFRSKFTARHSAGVAKTAEKLANFVGFSPNECKKMLVAGYLHDLGKLAIDTDILEKPSKLDPDEFNEMRSHTYYTYQLLKVIPQFDEINAWASYHHEKLNGTGYPFHFNGENLSLGSRIMAVADVFTAITENRPYRKGMEDTEAITVLRNMVTSGALEEKIVNLLIQNFDTINALRDSSQKKAGVYYANFFKDE